MQTRQDFFTGIEEFLCQHCTHLKKVMSIFVEENTVSEEEKVDLGFDIHLGTCEMSDAYQEESILFFSFLSEQWRIAEKWKGSYAHKVDTFSFRGDLSLVLDGLLLFFSELDESVSRLNLKRICYFSVSGFPGMHSTVDFLLFLATCKTAWRAEIFSQNYNTLLDALKEGMPSPESVKLEESTPKLSLEIHLAGREKSKVERFFSDHEWLEVAYSYTDFYAEEEAELAVQNGESTVSEVVKSEVLPQEEFLIDPRILVMEEGEDPKNILLQDWIKSEREKGELKVEIHRLGLMLTQEMNENEKLRQANASLAVPELEVYRGFVKRGMTPCYIKRSDLSEKSTDLYFHPLEPALRIVTKTHSAFLLRRRDEALVECQQLKMEAVSELESTRETIHELESNLQLHRDCLERTREELQERENSFFQLRSERDYLKGNVGALQHELEINAGFIAVVRKRQGLSYIGDDWNAKLDKELFPPDKGVSRWIVFVLSLLLILSLVLHGM